MSNRSWVTAGPVTLVLDGSTRGWLGMDSAPILENVFQSVGVTSGKFSLQSGSKFGLLYSNETFGILEQRNNNGSYTILKELDGKNHQTSLCKWIIIMFPDGLGNFVPVRSRKMEMN